MYVPDDLLLSYFTTSNTFSNQLNPSLYRIGDASLYDICQFFYNSPILGYGLSSTNSTFLDNDKPSKFLFLSFIISISILSLFYLMNPNTFLIYIISSVISYFIVIYASRLYQFQGLDNIPVSGFGSCLNGGGNTYFTCLSNHRELIINDQHLGYSTYAVNQHPTFSMTSQKLDDMTTLYIISSNTTIPLHTHDHGFLVSKVSGEMDFFYKDKWYPWTQDLWVPKNYPHSVRTINGGKFLVHSTAELLHDF